jgi:hypothetical protein
MMLTDDEARTLFHAVGYDLPRRGGVSDDALVRKARQEHIRRRAAQVVLAVAAVVAIVLGAASLPLLGGSPAGPSGEVAPTTAPASPATPPTTPTASGRGESCGARIRVPALEGMPIKRAKSVLRDVCLVADIRGPGGVVKHQQPSAGALAASGDVVYINMPSGPAAPKGVARRFLEFARGQLDGIPADTPVDLYIGGVFVKRISSEDQSQRDAWQACPDGGSYAGRTCPVSALTLLADHQGRIAFVASEPAHPCAHPVDPPDSLRPYQTVTLTPQEDQDCTSYFAVQLFVNDVSQIVAVNVVMSEP